MEETDEKTERPSSEKRTRRSPALLYFRSSDALPPRTSGAVLAWLPIEDASGVSPDSFMISCTALDTVRYTVRSLAARGRPFSNTNRSNLVKLRLCEPSKFHDVSVPVVLSPSSTSVCWVRFPV